MVCWSLSADSCSIHGTTTTLKQSWEENILLTHSTNQPIYFYQLSSTRDQHTTPVNGNTYQQSYSLALLCGQSCLQWQNTEAQRCVYQHSYFTKVGQKLQLSILTLHLILTRRKKNSNESKPSFSSFPA